MNTETEKCVIIMDEQLPLGILANTAAILGITIGMKMPDVVGSDVPDQDGNIHTGITRFPVPILRGTSETLKEIRVRLLDPQFSELTVIDFSDLAQSCMDYGDFTKKMADSPEAVLNYFGIAVCGNKKKVNKLTGSLPLLR
jgi:hypothetical protein